MFYGICDYSFSYIFLTGHPYCKLFVRLFCDFTASLKHLKPVWKYDPFNTWAKEIMASFRHVMIYIYSIMAFVLNIHSIFPSAIFRIIIDEHYLGAIKTRYLWQHGYIYNHYHHLQPHINDWKYFTKITQYIRVHYPYF